MSFTSLTFLLFLLVGGIIYFVIPMKARWVWLLVLSVIFYMTATPQMAVFLLITTVTTYFATKKMGKINGEIDDKNDTQRKQANNKKILILVLTVLLNVGILVFFKFSNFGINILNMLLPYAGLTLQLPNLSLIVPLGISFYTLQVVGYCIDVYKNKYSPEKNFGKYALFVLFFPHILQGPIARYDKLSQTLYNGSGFDYERVKSGLQLVLYGVFKKMVIADRAGIYVSEVYNNYHAYAFVEIFIATLFYSVQLYMDFSGCVDIARGVSEIFGVKIENNFNHPYFATSIKDFWGRWHISLSSWLKDYIYIPLGGNRKGKIRKYINIIIVFFVSGMWHGVGLNFIVWGLLHGAYQVIGDVLKPAKTYAIKKLGINEKPFSFKLCKIAITFCLVNFAWIFFRAKDISSAFGIIGEMFGSFNPWVLFDGSLYKMGLDAANFWLLIICIAMVFVISVMQEKMSVRKKLCEQNLAFRWIVYLVAIFAIIIFGIYGLGYDASSFIYGNF